MAPPPPPPSSSSSPPPPQPPPRELHDRICFLLHGSRFIQRKKSLTNRKHTLPLFTFTSSSTNPRTRNALSQSSSRSSIHMGFRSGRKRSNRGAVTASDTHAPILDMRGFLPAHELADSKWAQGQNEEQRWRPPRTETKPPPPRFQIHAARKPPDLTHQPPPPPPPPAEITRRAAAARATVLFLDGVRGSEEEISPRVTAAARAEPRGEDAATARRGGRRRRRRRRRRRSRAAPPPRAQPSSS
jgi:hypothetical protein